MGRLENLAITKTDKGTLRACGEIREKDKLLKGCVTYSGVDGRIIPAESEGNPDVQDEIIKKMQGRIKPK